jgi:hypothetical protein
VRVPGARVAARPGAARPGRARRRPASLAARLDRAAHRVARLLERLHAPAEPEALHVELAPVAQPHVGAERVDGDEQRLVGGRLRVQVARKVRGELVVELLQGVCVGGGWRRGRVRKGRWRQGWSGGPLGAAAPSPAAACARHIPSDPAPGPGPAPRAP